MSAALFPSAAADRRRVLVVGGAGYIGAHVCKALHGAGYAPVVVDDLSTGHAWAVRWGPLERCDVTDAAGLARVFARWRPYAVVHLAARSLVGESVRDPAAYYAANVGGALSLLQTMRASGVSRLVVSSSCAVYGAPARQPIDEATPIAPLSPYGETKAVVDGMLARFAAAYGLAAISLRYFNAAGADFDARIGESHDPETHLIPLVLDAAAGLRPDVKIFGVDHATPDGSCIRDYIHVDDLADAHLKAVQALEVGAGFDVFNLGGGVGCSVREVVSAAQRVTGRPIAAVAAPRRAGDPPALVACSAKARRTLGWAPKVTRLDDIVSSAWS
ncbi:MAG: UDP-glucose 4-epimerase GalE, partial [Pseudomonadota bacterium]